MACPFGNLSFHIDAGARLYGSLRRSAIRGQAFLRRSCAVTECGCACPVISFHGCAPFPVLAKVRSYTLRIPRLHSCAAREAVRKNFRWSVFLSCRFPSENGKSPSAENLPRESRSPAPPPPCEMRFRRAAETVYFSPRRTRDSSYCLRSRVPRMFSIILISPSFSA